MDRGLLSVFEQVGVQHAGDGDGTVLTAGTAYADHQLALALLAVKRQEIIDIRVQMREELACDVKAADIIAHLFIETCQGFELFDIKGIGQTAHIQHHVRLGRDPVLVAEGDAGDEQGIVSARGKEGRHTLLELIRIHKGRIDHIVRHRLDAFHQLILELDRFFNRTRGDLADQRMLAAGALESHKQCIGLCVEEQDLELLALQTELGQHLGDIGEHLAGTRVRYHGNLFHAVIRGVIAQIVEGLEQLRRQVVYAVIAAVLHGVQGVGLTRAGEPGQDDKFHIRCPFL